MNEKSIDGLLKKVNMIWADLPTIKDNLNYLKNTKLKDYRTALEKDQVRESLETAKDELIALLTHMNIMSEDMIKKIDMESWREYRDSK